MFFSSSVLYVCIFDQFFSVRAKLAKGLYKKKILGGRWSIFWLKGQFGEVLYILFTVFLARFT